VLYFAYGSNLCGVDLARWCRESSLPPVRLDRVAPGFLPDRRLAFTHQSTTRGGGVLDVPEAKGAAAPGVLFRIPEEDSIRALDLKESRGHAYRRIETVALTDNGGEQPVFTYEVEPGRRIPFVAPSAGYVDVVRRGYREHELPIDVLDAAARGESHRGPIRQLFVYGTLLPGEERHPVLGRHGASTGEAASVQGTLLDLGAYPGLIVEGATTRVRGEVYDVPDSERFFVELDGIEMFNGFGVSGSTYRRALVRADRPGRASTLAWTYLYGGRRAGIRVIDSGDWRGRLRP
jgi:gamma-glutamylcyclotransferase (GGCT)/AIG2-like uncharacterized protein YtfP